MANALRINLESGKYGLPRDLERAGGLPRLSIPVRRRRPLFLVTVALLVACALTLLSASFDATRDAPSLFKPSKYEVVPGFFAQSLNGTDDSTFDFV